MFYRPATCPPRRPSFLIPRYDSSPLILPSAGPPGPQALAAHPLAALTCPHPPPPTLTYPLPHPQAPPAPSPGSSSPRCPAPCWCCGATRTHSRRRTAPWASTCRRCPPSAPKPSSSCCRVGLQRRCPAFYSPYNPYQCPHAQQAVTAIPSCCLPPTNTTYFIKRARVCCACRRGPLPVDCSI